MSVTNPAAEAQSSAATMHWHPGQEQCGYCDYPATRIMQAGNGTKTSVCDGHIRCGSQITDGDHHTYMAHPNVFAHLVRR